MGSLAPVMFRQGCSRARNWCVDPQVVPSHQRLRARLHKVDGGGDVLLSPSCPVSLCILGLARINTGSHQSLIIKTESCRAESKLLPVGYSPGLPESPGAGGSPKHANHDLKLDLRWATRVAFGSPLGPDKHSAQGCVFLDSLMCLTAA